MTNVDPRLVTALHEQLARRPAGVRRVGWKVGGGERERIGGEFAVGHLTSATTLEDGATYRGGGADLYADVEVAVDVGAGATIARYGVALEINDLADGADAEAVVAGNVFHRAVAFGPTTNESPIGMDAALVVNGERRASAPARGDFPATIAGVERILGAVGETLQSGDRIIAGLIANTPLSSGDHVVAEVGALGRVALRIA